MSTSSYKPITVSGSTSASRLSQSAYRTDSYTRTFVSKEKVTRNYKNFLYIKGIATLDITSNRDAYCDFSNAYSKITVTLANDSTEISKSFDIITNYSGESTKTTSTKSSEYTLKLDLSSYTPDSFTMTIALESNIPVRFYNPYSSSESQKLETSATMTVTNIYMANS
jgi:UDP-N-acetylmuramyl tripeptide synthase